MQDLFDIKKWLGWRGKWHKIVATVIFDGCYLILWECAREKNIVQRIECEYKQGKAYSANFTLVPILLVISVTILLNIIISLITQSILV